MPGGRRGEGGDRGTGIGCRAAGIGRRGAGIGLWGTGIEVGKGGSGRQPDEVLCVFSRFPRPEVRSPTPRPVLRPRLAARGSPPAAGRAPVSRGPKSDHRPRDPSCVHGWPPAAGRPRLAAHGWRLRDSPARLAPTGFRHPIWIGNRGGHRWIGHGALKQPSGARACLRFVDGVPPPTNCEKVRSVDQ